jgi:hypothetical protein
MFKINSKSSVILLCYFIVNSCYADSNNTQAESIYDWAEKKYSHFFSPEHAETQSIDIDANHWHYRYYPETNNYVGHQGNQLYVSGDVFGGLLYIDEVDAFYEQNFNQLVDLTDIILEQQSTNCVDYIKKYQSSVNDINRNISFQGELTITLSNDKCVFTSNAIPNHDFNDALGSFNTDVSEQNQQYEVTTSPMQNSVTTALSLRTDNAIFLNGVKLDILSAGCFEVSDGKSGCFDINEPWRYDPMFGEGGFGTDSHHAHAQNEGTYHYHGSPNALFEFNTAIVSPVIGFAADGFPIYGSYFNDQGVIRKALSSYSLKTGSRVAINDVNPGGNYDGTYVDD